MKIELLKKFYTISELSEMVNISHSAMNARIKNLEIEADVKIAGAKAYGEDSMRKILGFFSFEKSYWETINSFQPLSKETEEEQFIIIESEMNKYTI